MSMKILKLRKQLNYRFLEGFLGYVSIAFFIFMIVLAIVNPTLMAIFILLYSFGWLLRITLIYTYTIYSYKSLNRWGDLDTYKMIKTISIGGDKAKKMFADLRSKFKGKMRWTHSMDEDYDEYKKIQNTKFAIPTNVFQFPVFAIYNEPSAVLIRSLKSIYESDYDLGHVVVFISQEGRMGEQFNSKIREEVLLQDWVSLYNISENNLDIVYKDNYKDLSYSNKEFENVEISKNKLTIIFTQHPDGLEGEIKGKASNEDWGGRQIGLFAKSKKLDPEMIMITSLDADSQLSQNYFSLLSYKYCLTPNRLQRGFEPIPVYTNNYFECTLLPRLISTQTTLWQLSQNNLYKSTVFFANYSVSLSVLEDVNFWEREYIAEDYLFYAKCLAHYKGDFRVLSFYGMFKGDTVVGDDYIQSLENQYKQLQRWTWGGVEGFPYVVRKFFWKDGEGRDTPFWMKIRAVLGVFLNHFFWATTPFIFSIGVILPSFFGGSEFAQTQISHNLSTFAQYFAWISFIFIAIYTFIVFKFVARESIKGRKFKTSEILKLLAQAVFSPLIYSLMGIPALDSQIRGIRGKYMGYWVTPKK